MMHVKYMHRAWLIENAQCTDKTQSSQRTASSWTRSGVQKNVESNLPLQCIHLMTKGITVSTLWAILKVKLYITQQC